MMKQEDDNERACDSWSWKDDPLTYQSNDDKPIAFSTWMPHDRHDRRYMFVSIIGGDVSGGGGTITIRLSNYQIIKQSLWRITRGQIDSLS